MDIETTSLIKGTGITAGFGDVDVIDIEVHEGKVFEF